jgi:hypothetical protein
MKDRSSERGARPRPMSRAHGHRWSYRQRRCARECRVIRQAQRLRSRVARASSASPLQTGRTRRDSASARRSRSRTRFVRSPPRRAEATPRISPTPSHTDDGMIQVAPQRPLESHPCDADVARFSPHYAGEGERPTPRGVLLLGRLNAILKLQIRQPPPRAFLTGDRVTSETRAWFRRRLHRLAELRAQAERAHVAPIATRDPRPDTAARR